MRGPMQDLGAGPLWFYDVIVFNRVTIVVERRYTV